MRLTSILFVLITVWSCNSIAPQKPGRMALTPDPCLLKYMGDHDTVLSIDTMKVDTIVMVTTRIMHRYPDGKKKSITEYGECKKSGRDTMFYPNGQVKHVRDVAGDNILFTHKYYSINGDSLNPGNVVWGEGTIYNYYDDGRIESTGHVKNGLPDGEWRRYYHNGKVSSVTFYHNKNTPKGIEFTIDGKMTFYRESGVIQRESAVDMGVIKYIKEYDEKGMLVKEYPANLVIDFNSN